MARELAGQHVRELQSQARQRSLAHSLRAASRARRRVQADDAAFVPPVIPDYVKDITGLPVPEQHGQSNAGRTAA
jgi:hypothetical protein